MTQRENEGIRRELISASDDWLQHILSNTSSFDPDIVSVAVEVWNSRLEGRKPPDVPPESKQSHEMLKSQGQDTETASYLLTELCARWYCLTFEIGLWLILIGGTIAGAVIGHSLAREAGVFFGLIIGFIIALIVMLNAGGLISVFLKLCADVAEIKGKLKN